jgi:two-component system chemotaxis sensor kinase CheA
LDVVEMNVERVGGNVRVESKPGAGSSFEITLPVTFGLLETTSVRSGNQVYLLDNSHIVSSRSIDSHEIEMSDTGDFLLGDNEALRLVNLHELLEHADDDSEMETFGLLVCQFPPNASNRSGSSAKLALLVDEIGETQQVLVRNLGSRGARWFGVAGAAELPDGSVALLLDLARLTNTAL